MKKMLLVLPLFVAACANSPKQEQAAQPTTPASGPKPESMSEATANGRWDIMSSPHLTLEQKTKIMQLMNQTQEKVASLRQTQSDLKAALFRSLSEGKYDKKKMNSFKRQMKKIEGEKMDLMFSNLDQIRLILGDMTDENQQLFRDFNNRAYWW